MRLIELIIDEDAELYGIDAISLVEKPAIENNFLKFKKQPVTLAEVDADKRMLVGAALIPDKPIYRQDGESEFHVYFSKNTVRKAMELFFKFGNQSNTTLEHEHKLNGLSVVESWIVMDKDKDKSAYYGLDVPVGTWMVAVKVENEAIWNDYIKTDLVKGFSIEGYFIDRMKANKDEQLMKAIEKLLQKC
jgi:hypothetical protein